MAKQITVLIIFTGIMGSNPIWATCALSVFVLFSYIDVLISLWLFLLRIFLFAAQPKNFLDGLKKL
jgi:hypothetical protein